MHPSPTCTWPDNVSKHGGPAPLLTVYRNLGNGSFSNVTAGGGLVTTVELQRLYAAPVIVHERGNAVAAQSSPSRYLEF